MARQVTEKPHPVQSSNHEAGVVGDDTAPAADEVIHGKELGLHFTKIKKNACRNILIRGVRLTFDAPV